MLKVAVVDYQMGNLHSVAKALERARPDFALEIRVTNKEEFILESNAIVLPGVGAFGKGICNLEKLGLIEPLKRKISQGIPFLGICLGMQLLFSESEEHGRHQGLDVVKGKVLRFPPGVKIPHMGWNQVEVKKGDELFENIPDCSYFYFVHSYYVEPEEESLSIGFTEYGIKFTSAIRKSNLIGVQFHPEKSQRLGLELLSNFFKKLN